MLTLEHSSSSNSSNSSNRKIAAVAAIGGAVAVGDGDGDGDGGGGARRASRISMNIFEARTLTAPSYNEDSAFHLI
ncbi:hypothetical protein M0804_012047 [Polistes exclamans]|nr:hypothetical protein M0804_012047 [Polistes exclamans]